MEKCTNNFLSQISLVRIRFVSVVFILVALLISCKEQDKKGTNEEMDSKTETIYHSDSPDFSDQGNLVEVTSTAMDFQVSDRIPSGWTTFRYYNKSPMTHFFILRSLPVVEGQQKTVQDQYDETIDIYDGALKHIIAGKREEGFALLAEVPSWVGEMVNYGGVGMLSPGETGQTDIYLEPGLYQMECYIKTGGRFHASLGMYKEIVVNKENSGSSPPHPTLKMNISTGNGFEIEGDIQPGRHVLEVYFKNQVRENGSGHDVHLVKLSEDSELDELANWMTWMTPTGMETPAPAGTFLGGVQNLRAGETGYMTVDLTPGDYAWISEGTNLASRYLLQKFTVNAVEN